MAANATPPLRLAVDAREFVAGRRTGIGRLIENLLLPLLDRRDVQLRLLVNTHADRPASLYGRNVRARALPKWPTPAVDQIAIPALTARLRCNVFFSPYYKVPFTGPFRRIITVPDIMFLRVGGRFSARNLVAALQVRLAVRRADRICTISRFSADDLCAYAPAARRKISVVYPSLEPAWFEPAPEADIRAARGRYAEGGRYVLYVGNFKPHKNVELLVRSFSSLRGRGGAAGVRLLLVGGDARHMAPVRAAIRGEQAESFVSVCRDIPDADLRSLYRGAEAFVTLSEYEGFGYPIAEAMACGCPVIFNPNTSMPEVAGDDAVKIPSLTRESAAAAIGEALALPPDARADRIRRGRERARRFEAGASSAALLAVARELAGAGNPA